MTESPGNAARAAAMLEQLALDLAFVQPDVTPAATIRSIVVGIDEACTAAPQPMRQAIAACLRWLAPVGDRGPLSVDMIRDLNAWQPWMVSAALAWERQQPCPPVPEAWAASAESAAAAVVGVGDEVAVAVLPVGFDDEMIGLFCEESQDLLREMEQGVLTLERSPTDTASIDTVFRVFHTFKGNAGVLKLVVLQRLTHELESVLDAARRGQLRLGREAIDLILAGGDLLRRYVDESLLQLGGQERGRSIPLPIPALTARVKSLLRGGGGTSPGVSHPVEMAPAPVAETPPRVPHAGTSPAPVGDDVAPPDTAAASPSPPSATPPLVEPPTADRAGPSAGGGAAAAATGSTVRVDTRKLDGLIDLVGELVVAQSLVTQSPEIRTLASQHLDRCLGQLRSITSELQRTAMALRMVPIGGVFRRMGRLVRDLSVELGKDINLRMEGEETELDRSLVELLADPLVHMIRNSADHGIEPPAVRAAGGKPAQGLITLRAYHQGGFVVIRVEDDGRGLAADRILAKAIDRGLVQHGQSLERADILDLIFAPGFSTAEQITGLSGRGVGMDVVRRGIEGIRGKVEVESVDGRGTTFTLYVPLTLAIIEGLLVGIGDERYIVPTLSVRESFRPLPGAVTTVHGRGELVAVRGRLTPLLRLGRHLGTPTRATDPAEGIVVVVESGQDVRCLLVDELLGKQEVVIKSLGETFRSQPVFAGAAILGDGRVGLILDVNALVKLKAAAGEAA
jgi:two-component system chemotaxis sensor kinase CheA